MRNQSTINVNWLKNFSIFGFELISGELGDRTKPNPFSTLKK